MLGQKRREWKIVASSVPSVTHGCGLSLALFFPKMLAHSALGQKERLAYAGRLGESAISVKGRGAAWQGLQILHMNDADSRLLFIF